MQNPYQTRPFIIPGEPRQLEVYDSRDNIGVQWFAMTAEGAAEARAYAANRWIAEAVAESRGLVEHDAAELAPAVELMDAREAEALAQHLVGELDEYTTLGLPCDARYDAKSAQVRALGYEIGPDAAGRLVLWHADNSGPLHPEPADVRDACADLAPALPVYIGITPTAEQLDAALVAREEAAQRAMWACKAAEDVEGAKIAKNSANAYRKARAMALHPDGTIRQAPNGDLLVRSSERSGHWHTVSRQPRHGSDYSPISCSCEFGQTVGKLGICWHYAAFEGWYDAAELAVVEADARAAFGVAA